MAAYGALVSLSHIPHHILHPPPLNKIIIPREQIEFLQGKVSFLIEFLETYSSRRSHELRNLETKIADAAYEAEDIIESNVVEQIRATGGENISTLLCEGIQTVLGNFLSMEKELMKMGDIQRVGDLKSKSIATATSSRSLPSGNNALVGFEEHRIEIMDALASDESNRQIIPIVGMGGIGKTTLATVVYNNPCIVEHFHVRAWVTVSQEYTVGELLLCLLSEITKAGPNKQESTDDEIGELLYKELFGRKYLIVMDDMWDIEAWSKVERFLPDNRNGSRILVTTRLSKLANDFKSCSPHQIELLDEEKSWDLLCGEVFGKENCPAELVKIGQNIAKKCGGLPLALVVIGGLLVKSERTKEYWEFVEGDVTSATNYGNDEHLIMEILSSSYSHLPIHLKPCFLYLALFPEDFEIRVSPLIWLWVAEGLIKPTPSKCLEDVAHEYLEDLISRNLILVHQRRSSGKVRSCKIHDLVREVCIKEAETEKFVCIAKLDNPNIPPNLETKRRLSISSNERQEKMVIEALQSARFNRSWLSHGKLLRYFKQEPDGIMGVSSEEQVYKIIHGFRLLKVVHVKDVQIKVDISKLSNLRYVGSSRISISSISLCWNLQTLVTWRTISLPAEIWQMPQLRHLKLHPSILPDPPNDQNVIVLGNLQTVERVKNFKCTEEVLKRIPNLRRLVMHRHYYTEGQKVEDYCLKNLFCLKKLESLGIKGGGELLMDIALPISLKKLSLSECNIPWEDLSFVGKLPNLQVLKLWKEATKGKEWNPIEGEFRRLKYLLIWGCELKMWGADNSHFPCLERLVLGFVNLEKIPESFAEISTLQAFEFCYVANSIWKSAREISDDRQEQLGYEPLQILHYNDEDWYNFKLSLICFRMPTNCLNTEC